MSALRTPRLLLIPGTLESLEAELVSRQALGDALGVDVPDSWPPELYDEPAIRWTIGWLASHPDERSWTLYYIAVAPMQSAERPRLVGIAGYKGAPDSTGVVEVGYGVVPEERRKGYAREALRGLVARAFADQRVSRVIAQTLPELMPSIGVLQTAGFQFDGPGSDPDEPTAIRFVLTREAYAASGASPAARGVPDLTNR